jgi:hypothetical protein
MTSWASLLAADDPQRRVSLCLKGRANSGVSNNEAMDHRSSDVGAPESVLAHAIGHVGPSASGIVAAIVPMNKFFSFFGFAGRAAPIVRAAWRAAYLGWRGSEAFRQHRLRVGSFSGRSATHAARSRSSGSADGKSKGKNGRACGESTSEDSLHDFSSYSQPIDWRLLFPAQRRTADLTGQVGAATMKSAEITAALGGSGACYGDGWWRCPCPAHKGRSESLSIRDGGRYGISVKCFGGCGRDQIFAAINAKLGTQFGLIKPAREDFDEVNPDTRGTQPHRATPVELVPTALEACPISGLRESLQQQIDRRSRHITFVVARGGSTSPTR